MRAGDGCECRKLSKSSKGLVLSANRRITLNRFALFLTERVEAYFRLDFFGTFLIKQESTIKNIIYIFLSSGK
jgi:hypothetical protein